MRYRGFYIDECDIDDVIRQDGAKEVECDGIVFTIYADCDYEYEIDNFIGAFGFEIEENQESIENFVRLYIDSAYDEYKKIQFKYILDNDYNNYKYDVRTSDDYSDVWEYANEVASIQEIYKSLKNSKDIPIEQMEYIISLHRPLETIYYKLELNKNQFVEDVKTALKSVISNKDCTFGYVIDYESSDENVIDRETDGQNFEMNGSGMDMQ